MSLALVAVASSASSRGIALVFLASSFALTNMSQKALWMLQCASWQSFEQ